MEKIDARDPLHNASKNLYIYHVTCSDMRWIRDTYSEFIIIAEDEDHARNTHPDSMIYKWWENDTKYKPKYDTWISPDKVKTLEVELIGTANPSFNVPQTIEISTREGISIEPWPGQKGGEVILASFHAG